MGYNAASAAKFKFEILDFDYELSVVSFDVKETVSEPFVINLRLAGKEKIAFEDVKLQEGLLSVKGGVGAILNDESGDRYFHGVIRKFKHSGTSGKLNIYEVQMVPSLWLLSLEKKCRLFQDKPLKEIIGALLQEQYITSDLYEFRLDRDDIFIKFSMQYQETNLNYLSRLLEHEGIFYFFEHFEDKHVLVFCDTEAFYQEITGQSSIPFNTNGMVAEKENVFAFKISERLRPGKLSQKNYNFKTPSVDLSTDHEAKVETSFEIYEYPGPYGEKRVGDTLSQIRLEELRALAKRGYGNSCCPRFQAGATFTLTEHRHDDFNDEYFFHSVTHEGKQPQALRENASGSAHYSNSFTVIPATVIYRPERTTPKPMVPGLLSAIVTGPKGEEIWPDEYGRVNVQFHFDREGKMDEKSSCWLRTIQFWNGTTWGSQFIPRIGDEVLVSFINGDMDYPIITGSVVNEAKQPNYDLPANKTQSGIRTRSTPGGTANNFNELRFEDKMGKEEVYLQGEKDWNILIKNDKGQTIGHDEKLLVKNDRTKNVDHDQKETIGNNKDITVVKDHTESIGENMVVKIGQNLSETTGENKTVSVGKDLNETISQNAVIHTEQNRSLTVGANSTERIENDLSTTVGNNRKLGVGGNLSMAVNNKTMISSGEEITFVCGAATIVLKSSGKILINGSDLSLLGSGNVVVKGQKIGHN